MGPTAWGVTLETVCLGAAAVSSQSSLHALLGSPVAATCNVLIVEGLPLNQAYPGNPKPDLRLTGLHNGTIGIWRYNLKTKGVLGLTIGTVFSASGFPAQEGASIALGWNPKPLNPSTEAFDMQQASAHTPETSAACRA